MNAETGSKDILAQFKPWPLFREAALICLIGAFLGLGVNYSLVREALHGRKPAVVVPHTDPGQSPAFPVARDEVVRMLQAGALAVDARSREFYAEGHIAGARSLPVGELDVLLPSFLAEVALETPLVVYCSGYGCPDSEDVAARLMSEGFGEVRVYEGGFPEWRDAGLPVEAGGRRE